MIYKVASLPQGACFWEQYELDYNYAIEHSCQHMPNPFTARWSAQGNNLCLGHWRIEYNERPLELEAGRGDEDMGSYGIYSYIFPDDESFAEGMTEDEWIGANGNWLTGLFTRYGIPTDEKHMRLFYQAINPQDWRCGLCGGCL